MKQSKNEQRWLQIMAGIALALLFCFSMVVLMAYQFGWEMFWAKGYREVIFRPVVPDTLWNYMDAGFEPGVGNVWTTQRYDTAEWKRGSGLFAAEDAYNTSGADVLLKPGTGAGATYFFRCEFDLDDISEIQAMQGSIRYSDAVLVYLNGEIIFAGNVPSGGYSSNQELGAADSFEHELESNFEVTDIDALREGTNILAVEIHQRSRKEETASFSFADFSLIGGEIEEEAPDVSALALAQGRSEEEIAINWRTSSEGFYQVEYLSEDRFDERRDTQTAAEQVLMGRVRGAQGGYVNTVTLSRLKTGTVYYYRILKVGGKEGSSWRKFQTAGTSGYNFHFFGDSEGISFWEDRMLQSIEHTGRPDLIVYAGAKGQGDQSEGIRNTELVKQIPFASATTSSNRMNADGYGYTFTYQDTLFILLNDREHTQEEMQTFLRKAVKNNQRKWVIVAMYESVPNMEEKRAEAYESVFREIGASLVLCGENVNSPETVQAGRSYEELLFVNGSLPEEDSAVWVQVRRNSITISRYHTQTGEEESFQIHYTQR